MRARAGPRRRYHVADNRAARAGCLRTSPWPSPSGPRACSTPPRWREHDSRAVLGGTPVAEWERNADDREALIGHGRLPRRPHRPIPQGSPPGRGGIRCQWAGRGARWRCRLVRHPNAMVSPAVTLRAWRTSRGMVVCPLAVIQASAVILGLRNASLLHYCSLARPRCDVRLRCARGGSTVIGRCEEARGGPPGRDQVPV